MTNSGASRLLRAADKWAELTPHTCAVSAPDGVLDFEALAHQRKAIASELASAGVGPGVHVALCLSRSKLSVAAVLAVWQLGATAVPIDDRHPVDRINFVLRDSGATILLGDRLPAGAAPRRIRRIACDSSVAGAEESVGVEPNHQDSAYIIYTSGTTGWPKGVEVTYAGLSTFLTALSGLDLPSGGTGINAVSPAFDGWLWCMTLLLMHGQAMTIIDLAGQDQPEADLAGRIAAVEPQTICLTPSLLSTCVDSADSAETLVVAGEALPYELCRRAMDRRPDRRMLNVYGPTEATIAACWSDSAQGDDVLTIGGPLPGYTVHILDDDGQPVPSGQSGELYIGGPALARGYRNRPDLTADRFVPDPFAGDGSRLYRTGDVVTSRADGRLEFVGRQDGQVKVRGFRIELDEIELLATSVPGVRSAAAFVTRSGDSVGLAVTAAAQDDASTKDLVSVIRQKCAQQLPDHSRPSVVDLFGALPTTVTGKVDRVALAEAAGSASGTTGRAPATDREAEVLAVWNTLLDQPVHDVDADFFELGGHSLLAARAVAELRKHTGLRVRLQDLLANPTAAELAAVLDALTADEPVGRALP